MLGVCYHHEHWPENWWVEDGRRMRELGIALRAAGATAPLLRLGQLWMKSLWRCSRADSVFDPVGG